MVGAVPVPVGKLKVPFVIGKGAPVPLLVIAVEVMLVVAFVTIEPLVGDAVTPVGTLMVVFVKLENEKEVEVELDANDVMVLVTLVPLSSVTTVSSVSEEPDVTVSVVLVTMTIYSVCWDEYTVVAEELKVVYDVVAYSAA